VVTRRWRNHVDDSTSSGTDSRAKILRAATAVFAERGKHGARMEDIAAHAGVNKALIYYYYGSRQKLYRQVLKSTLAANLDEIFQALREVPQGEHRSRDLIRLLSRTYFTIFSRNLHATKIVIEALANEPDLVREVRNELVGEKLVRPSRLLGIFEQEIGQGALRPVDPKQLFLSIVGMNLIYFLVKPIAEVFLAIDVVDEEEFIRAREDSIVDLLLHGVIPREPGDGRTRSTGEGPGRGVRDAHHVHEEDDDA
jgi:AcrR family transcriptional regulator